MKFQLEGPTKNHDLKAASLMKQVLLRLDLGIAGMGIKTHDTTTVSAIQNVHMHQLLTRFNIISDFESSIKLSDSFFFFLSFSKTNHFLLRYFNNSIIVFQH